MDTTIVDPLGRAITLHDYTWYGHILKRHPEMRRHRTDAEGALRKPLEIRYSTSDPNCRLFYAQIPSRRIMIVVVADVVEGIVRTGYPATRMTGAVEWSPPIR